MNQWYSSFYLLQSGLKKPGPRIPKHSPSFPEIISGCWWELLPFSALQERIQTNRLSISFLLLQSLGVRFSNPRAGWPNPGSYLGFTPCRTCAGRLCGGIVIHAPFLFRAVGLDFLLSKLLRADATRFRPDLHKRRRADFAEALPDLSSAGRSGSVLHAYV